MTAKLRCIIGPNGAGKNHIDDVITGKTKTADSGSIWFGQRIDLAPSAPEHEIRPRRDWPQVPRKPTIFEALSVFEKSGSWPPPRTRKSWYTLNHLILSGEQRESPSNEVLTQIAWTEAITGRKAGLPCPIGRKQWLEIGMLLVPEPRVLLVDEPVAGYDGEESSTPTIA